MLKACAEWRTFDTSVQFSLMRDWDHSQPKEDHSLGSFFLLLPKKDRFRQEITTLSQRKTILSVFLPRQKRTINSTYKGPRTLELVLSFFFCQKRTVSAKK